MGSDQQGGQDDEPLDEAHGWVALFGEREAIQIVGGGPFDGQRGYVVEPWIDTRDEATSALSYLVHLDTSGVNETFAHEQLKSLGYKHPSFRMLVSDEHEEDGLVVNDDPMLKGDTATRLRMVHVACEALAYHLSALAMDAAVDDAKVYDDLDTATRLLDEARVCIAQAREKLTGEKE